MCVTVVCTNLPCVQTGAGCFPGNVERGSHATANFPARRAENGLRKPLQCIVRFALTGRVRLLALKTERQGRVAGALSAGTRPHVPRLDARPLDKR